MLSSQRDKMTYNRDTMLRLGFLGGCSLCQQASTLPVRGPDLVLWKMTVVPNFHDSGHVGSPRRPPGATDIEDEPGPPMGLRI